MSGMIGDLVTVNGGTVIDFSTFSAEVMGPGYSTHPSKLVAVYAKEGHIKVELIYDGEHDRFFIYRFKGYAGLQHYWSTNVSREWVLRNKKYKSMGEACLAAWNSIFKK